MLDLLQECSGAKVIGITGHVRPDGDCVGSCIALYLFLKKAIPQAEVTVYLEESARAYYHMTQVKEIDIEFRPKEEYDVFFCLDSMPDRTGQAEELYKKAKKTINIDHHITNDGCGDVNEIHPEIGSCAEVIYDLIPESYIDQDIARALYIGIIHDTGVFQFSNTRPSTLITASKLIQYDIDFANLIQESFYEKSYKQTKIMAEAVLRSKMYLEGKCLLSYMTQEDMAHFQVNPSDFNGVINRLKMVRGTDCAVFMYELTPNVYKVSLRTSEQIDAVVVTRVFGGGGHVRAAGCNMEGNAAEVIHKLLAEIERQLQ